MSDVSIPEQVRKLREEIAEIHKMNQQHRESRNRGWLEFKAQERRRQRLLEIIVELTRLSPTRVPPGE